MHSSLTEQIVAAAQRTNVRLCPFPLCYQLEIPEREQLAAAIARCLDIAPQAIPPTIHQVWIGPRRPPWKWIESFRKQLVARHPHWQYRLWREPDIENLNMSLRDIYQAEPQLHGKVDILRLEILNQFGGVYVDADMLWLEKSLDPLLELCGHSGFFVGRECEQDLANSVIGSSPWNPLLGLLTTFLRRFYNPLRGEQQFEPWQATGPRFITEVLRGMPCQIFPQHFFYPVSWHGVDPAIDTAQFADSYMLQYGYTTNNMSVE